jgi:hypothetical protein
VAVVGLPRTTICTTTIDECWQTREFSFSAISNLHLLFKKTHLKKCEQAERRRRA